MDNNKLDAKYNQRAVFLIVWRVFMVYTVYKSPSSLLDDGF